MAERVAFAIARRGRPTDSSAYWRTESFRSRDAI